MAEGNNRWPFSRRISLIAVILIFGASIYARQWVAVAIGGLVLQGVLREWFGLTWREGWSKTQRFAADLLILLFLMTVVVVSPGYVDIRAIALVLLVTSGWLVWRIRKLRREK